MFSQLRTGSKVVGIKQSRRAILEDKAACVFFAQDADPHVTAPLLALCQEKAVVVETVDSMKELGAACGISVGAAVAVLLK